MGGTPNRLTSTALTGFIVKSCGDSAILLIPEPDSEDERWRIVHRLADAVSRTGIFGMMGFIAALDSLLIEFDCTVTSCDAVLAEVAAVRRKLGMTGERISREFSIPVVYGGEYGPDLPDVAAELGIPETAVVSAHAAAAHVIRCVVSPPGAPMIGIPSLPHPVQRRPTPSTRIPAGSIGLAGRQGIIYATSSPGGWRIIGRTPFRLFDVTGDPPVAYGPGDRLRFYPIPAEDWRSLAGQRIEGTGE